MQPLPHQLPTSYWRDRASYQSFWSARATAAAKLVGDAKAVADLGCGMQALRKELPAHVRYLPADLERWTDDTETCDLNAGLYPENVLRQADVAYLLGVLEYMRDVPALLAGLGRRVGRVVLSYNAVDLVNVDRQAHHWLNGYSIAEIRQIAQAAGFSVDDERHVENQVLLALTHTNA